MGKRANRRDSEAFRSRVRQMLAAGYSVARIVKETGKSLAHVTLIVGQEREALSDQSREIRDGVRDSLANIMGGRW